MKGRNETSQIWCIEFTLPDTVETVLIASKIRFTGVKLSPSWDF